MTSKYETGDWISSGIEEFDPVDKRVFKSGRGHIRYIVKRDIGVVTICCYTYLERSNGTFWADSPSISIPIDLFERLSVAIMSDANK